MTILGPGSCRWGSAETFTIGWLVASACIVLLWYVARRSASPLVPRTTSPGPGHRSGSEFQENTYLTMYLPT